MSSTATDREIYVIGKEGENTREVAVVENGEVHDFPASAKYTYASGLTQFPYVIA